MPSWVNQTENRQASSLKKKEVRPLSYPSEQGCILSLGVISVSLSLSLRALLTFTYSWQIEHIVLPSGHDHSLSLMNKCYNKEFGYGGMLVLDVKTKENAYAFMEAMQNDNIGYLAVSLGFYKTLFSAPGSSTSSEIPEEEQDQMGLSEGMVRISIGIDNDINRTFVKMKKCMKNVGIL